MRPAEPGVAESGAGARLPLATQRLILRDFEPGDWQALFASESDPDTVRYLPREPFTEDSARDYLRRGLEDAAARPRRIYDLAVVLKSDGAVVGRCGLEVRDASLGEAVIWYVLDRRHRGQGLMNEAAPRLLDFGFGELGLRRLVADIDPRNTASARLAEAVGMRREAHFLENVIIKGELCGTLIYAMLRREWEARRSSPSGGSPGEAGEGG